MNKMHSDIQYWLNWYKISDYTIGEDCIINVNGSVNLYGKNLYYIPYKFGTVSGSFDCRMNHLTSLQNCPTVVGDTFHCWNATLLTIDYLPTAMDRLDFNTRSFFIQDDLGLALIEAHENAFHYIKRPTAKMIQLHKMLWEV